MAQAYKCDVCKALFESEFHVYVYVDREMGPAGSMENKYDGADMCPTCCKNAVKTLLKLLEKSNIDPDSILKALGVKK